MNSFDSSAHSHALAAALQEPPTGALGAAAAENVFGLDDLNVARQIQHSLLPKEFPSLKGFRVAGFCLSALEVGGDFYDVVPLTQDRALLVVADVMGKGVPAALFAASLRTLIRSLVEWTHEPGELLSRVNRLMHAELSQVDMFITAQIALLNAHDRTLRVAGAGHCPLLLASAGNTKPRRVHSQGMPLGIVQDLVFPGEMLSLDTIACALMYTDGIPETCGSHGQFFGHQRLENWLGTAASQAPLSALELRQSFLAELNQFQGGEPRRDDQTLLVLIQEPAAVAGLPAGDALVGRDPIESFN